MSKIVSLLFLFFISVYAIHISDSNFDEVYSGPGGVPNPGWDGPADPFLYSNYLSVAQFLFTETSKSEYYYESVQEVFGPPVLSIESGRDVVDPVLFGIAAGGYYFDGLSYWEELPDLNIYFNCQRAGRAVLSLTIDTSLLREEDGITQSVNETVKFFFQKECFSPGYREGFTIGKSEGRSDDVVKHGVVQTRWNLESDYYLDANPIIIDEDEQLSVFHIAISNSLYGNQYYHEPVVIVEDDDLVDIQVRGNAQSGGTATGMPESLVLIYDCLDSGDTEITVSISLGFYGTIQFGFTKLCKTDLEDFGMPGVINVGTSRGDYAGVVSSSITSIFWQVDAPTVEIGSDEILTNFYVSTVSGKTQQILKPIISVYPSTAFKATLSGNIRDGGIVTGSPQHFTVNYICDRVSEGTIVITIKLPNAKTVEFSYTKQCKKLKRHTEQVWTANQLMVTFVLCIFALSVSLYILYRKKNSNQQPRMRA